LVAILIWLSPSWLAFFIPSLEPFAVKWLLLVVSPAVPSWAAIPVLAVIVGSLRVGIKKLYHWTQDQIKKLKYGAELFTLAGPELLEAILVKLRHMKAIKDKRTEEFKAELKEERMKLITDNWETTLEEAENK